MAVEVLADPPVLGEELLLHRQFEEQVRRTPDALAIRSDEGALSYGELDRRANRLAHHLVGSRAGPEKVIGICLERSPDMIVALLAILKSGSAYLPLDGDLPPERLAYMAQDAGTHCIVTSSECVSALEGVDAALILLDDAADAIQSRPDHSPQTKLHGQNLAYLLYTSGSTGNPKAVMGTHAAVANRIGWERGVTTGSDVFPFKLSLGQIDSLWEIFAPLCGGGQVAIIGQRERSSTDGLVRKFAEFQVSALVVVSSLLDALLDEPGFDSSALPNLKYIASTGEPLLEGTILKVEQRFQDIDFADIYGTTEFWDASCTILIHSGRRAKTLGLCEIHILDDRLQPVTDGDVGEVCIAGSSLARGYSGQSALTAAKFVPSPFGDGQRLYRTGDLGSLDPAGRLILHGRQDRQVSIIGNRVELDEIENRLLACPSVKQAVVLLSEAKGSQRIIAFVTASSAFVEHAPEDIERDILAYLRGHMPRHMIPQTIEVLDKLPISVGGKIDRMALLERQSPETEPVSRPPLSDTEAKLAQCWTELLPSAEVHRSSNFFNLGGNSLLAMQLIARIFHETGVQVALSDIFEQPALHALAGLVDAKAAETDADDFEDEASLAALIDNMSEDEIVAALLEVGESIDD